MKPFLPLLALTLLVCGRSLAQDTTLLRPALQHEMTPDERLRISEIGKNFVPTAPPQAPVRNVGEFERMQGALVRYPFGIPISLIKEMATDVMVTTVVASATQKTTVLNQYIANGVDTSHCNFLLAPSDSYWTRDYGPWFESDSSGQIGIVDFPYNRPRPNDDEIPKLMAAMLGIQWYGMDISHTGGNYMTDGYGISSSTDLVWVENSGQTHDQIAQKMHDYLGINDYKVVPDPNTQSTIDHIDCWGKFLTPDRILIRKTLPTDPEYTPLENAATYWSGQICSYGYPYKVIRVQTPQDQPYTNSVILNDKILVPFMNSNWDDSAKAVYEAAMPGYQVIGFIAQPSTPWLSTDALHCRVMGIADIGLLHVGHIPISGNQPCEQDYPLTAQIIAGSHQPVIADSVLIHYRVNGGAWQTTPMMMTSPEHYAGAIPKQAAGSEVKYYISAADQTGRRETAPFIGAADPFVFHTIYTNLTPVPDTLWFVDGNDAWQGKICQLHNFTAGTVSLQEIQMLASPSWYWFVDSVSVSTFPHPVGTGDSVAFRVKINIPLVFNPNIIFIPDSLLVTTAVGTFYVYIQINQDLISGFAAGEGKSLGLAQPNPFKDATSIPVSLAQAGPVSITVFDGRGVLVRTLFNGKMESGNTRIRWNGADDNGNRLPAGIYLIRMVAGDTVRTIRVAVL